MAQTLDEEGYDVYIFTKSTAKDAVYPHAKICPFPVRLLNLHMPFNLFWTIWIVCRALREKINLLIVRELPLALPAYLAAKILRVPILMDMRENYPAAIQAWGKKKFWHRISRDVKLVSALEKFIVPKMEHIFVVVDEQKARVAGLGVPTDKITVNMNTPTHDFVEKAKSLLNVTKPENPRMTLMYIGEVTRHRGIDEILQAFRKVVDRNCDLLFRIVGEGNHLQNIKSQVKNLQLQDYVKIESYYPADKVPEVIYDSDIGIINHLKTQHTETTIPNKLFEYMALGKPVIASNVGPIRRILEKENCGILVDPADTSELSQAIIQLYDSPQDRKEMGQNGHRAVCREYNWNYSSKKLLKVIEGQKKY